MMPDFSGHLIDRVACRREFEEFERFLGAASEHKEIEVVAFLRERSHLAALIGFYHYSVALPDRIAWEYPLFGEFRCDLVVGDSARSSYAFIEFEDANPTSLFVDRGGKISRDWSPRFERGYSQIIDWFYKLQAMTDSPGMEARFGRRAISYTGVLVVGRDRHQDQGERLRLEWRREYVVVNSKKVICVTYDQLLEDLRFRLDIYASASLAGE